MLPDWAKPVEDDGGSPFAAPEATSTLPDWAKPVGQSSPQRTLNGVPVLGDYTPLLEGRAKLRYGVSDEGYQAGVEKYGEEGFGAILHARESDPIESMPMAARIATKSPGNMLLKVDTLADKGNLVLSELMGDWSAARKYRKRIKYKEGLREYGDQMGAMATADNSIVSKIIEQGLTSATEFLAVSGLTGGAGVLPYLQATATADAYEEAKEQGKEGFAASMYAAAEGAGQTAITAVVGKTIAPGFERMGGKALGPVVTRHLGPSLSKLSGASEKVANAAIQGGAESFEEILQETASTVTATIAGVEREGTYLERAGFAAGAGFAGGAPVGFVAASKDFEDALAEVRRKTQEVVQATEDAQQHEGEPPPTDRDGFKKATGKPKTSSTYRDVYASVVESRQESRQDVERTPEQQQFLDMVDRADRERQGASQTYGEASPFGNEAEATPSAGSAAATPVDQKPMDMPASWGGGMVTDAPQQVVDAVRATIPKATVGTAEDGNYVVVLPNRTFFRLEFADSLESGFTDEAITNGLKQHGIEDTAENRSSMRKALKGAFLLSTPDGASVNGMGIVRILGSLRSDPHLLEDTIRHELFHLSRQLGLVSKSEFESLKNKYAKGLSDAKAEEAIAGNVEVWKGGIVDKLITAFDNLLTSVGIARKASEAERSFRSGEVFLRQPVGPSEAAKKRLADLENADKPPVGTTPDVQEQINAELEDVARERFESKLDPQQLTPTEVEGLNAKVRTWTNDTDFVRKIVGLGGRDVRLPQQVLDRAEELYERDWELYDASVANLTELDIDWNRLISEYRKTEDAAEINGYDDALMTLTRARFGDDFVQDNVDVAADELSNILNGAEIRFGKPVFPNIKEPPSREQSIAQAYEDVTEQLPPPVDPEGQVEGEWFPQQKVYLEDPTQVDYDPTLTSARNAWMRPLREYLGLTALDSPARRGWQAVLQEAKDRGVPEAALDIADKVIAKPTTLNDVETAGFVIRAAQLKQEYELSLHHLMEAEARGDQYVAASSEAKAGRIEDELDRLTRALKVAGTEAGRNLAARKLTVDDDYNLATVVARARLRKGAPLTDSERRGFAARDKDLQKELKGFEEAVAARDLKAAEDAIGIGKKRARPTKAAMDQAYALVDQLLRVGCDLG